MQNQTYPHQQKREVQRYWPEGKHPAQCKGECMITGACGIYFCARCLWDEFDNLLIEENGSK